MTLDTLLYIIIGILLIYLFYTNKEDIGNMKFENTTNLSILLIAGLLLVCLSINLHQWLGTNYSIVLVIITYLILSLILSMYYFGYKENKWGQTMLAFTIGQIIGLLVSTDFDPITRFTFALIIMLYTLFLSSSISGLKNVFDYIGNMTVNNAKTISSEMNNIIIELNTIDYNQ